MGDEPPIYLAAIRPLSDNPDATDSPLASPPPKENTERGRTPTRTSEPAAPSAAPPRVTFDRHELDRILSLYGRMVAAGEWRDYAIDFTREKAIFSVFRRTADVPVYRIEKDPRLARKQGAYSVVSQTGLILKRGHELPRVLAVLEKPLRTV